MVSKDSTVNLFRSHFKKKKKTTTTTTTTNKQTNKTKQKTKNKRFMSESHADVDLWWDESSLR